MIQQSKWVSLYELVTDHKKPIDHGGLATAIEKHVLQYIDEHGRRKLATNGPEEDACSINFALRLLFTYKVAPEDHPIFYEFSELFKFGWPEDDLPDFSSINPHYVAPHTTVGKVPKSQLVVGMTKQPIINAFEGVYWDRDKWGKYLASPPQWLTPCRISKGNKAVSATWNPVLIGIALMDKNIALKKLDSVFIGLKDWKDEWQETSSHFR